jgi:hypothetical protein
MSDAAQKVVDGHETELKPTVLVGSTELGVLHVPP